MLSIHFLGPGPARRRGWAAGEAGSVRVQCFCVCARDGGHVVMGGGTYLEAPAQRLKHGRVHRTVRRPDVAVDWSRRDKRTNGGSVAEVTNPGE